VHSSDDWDMMCHVLRRRARITPENGDVVQPGQTDHTAVLQRVRVDYGIWYSE